MESRAVYSSALAAAAVLSVSFVLIYLAYVATTGGEGVLSGIFVSMLLAVFICPSLILAGLFHVLLNRKRRLVSAALSILINLAFAYLIYRELVPSAGVTNQEGITIVRHTGADAVGIVSSFVSFAVGSCVVVSLFYWFESKLFGRK